MGRKLEEIIEEFENTELAFESYRKKSELKRHELLEYEARFVRLKSEFRPYKKLMVKEWTRRDDKAASAIKFRIAISIHKGEYKDKEGNLIFDPCSISAAEKFASGCQSYKEFVDQRAFFKESLNNVTDLRNDCDSYVNLIKDIIKPM